MNTRTSPPLTILITIVITALVVGGAVWYWQSMQANQASNPPTTPSTTAQGNSSPAATVTTPSSATSATVTTVGLKPASFTSTRFGYSLSLPAGFIIEFNPGGEGGPSDNLAIKKLTPDDGTEVIGTTGVSLAVYPNTNSETIDGRASAAVKKDSTATTRKPDTTIAGEKVAVVEIGGLGVTTEYYFIHAGNMFTLTEDDNRGTVDSTALQTVIKNFKFTK